MEICSNLWEWSISCDWSNIQTFTFEIIMGILLAVGIGKYFQHLEQKRRNERQQYAFFQINPYLEFLLQHLKFVERMSINHTPSETGVLSDPYLSIAKDAITQIRPIVNDAKKILEIVRIDIDPKITQKINAVLTTILLYDDNVQKNVAHSPSELMRELEKTIQIVKDGSDKFKKQLSTDSQQA